MFETKIFEAALAIQSPWFIKDVQFDVAKKRLDIFIDFKRGSTGLGSYNSKSPFHDGHFMF